MSRINFSLGCAEHEKCFITSGPGLGVDCDGSYKFIISALILFVVLRFKVTAAVTGCVIITVGIVFCVLSVMQNSYHWRTEHNRAAKGLPVYELPSGKQDGVEGPAARELSTLV